MTLEQWKITESSITYLVQPEFSANWLYDDIDEIELDLISGAFWQDEEKNLLIFGIEWKDGAEPELKKYKSLIKKAAQVIKDWV